MTAPLIALALAAAVLWAAPAGAQPAPGTPRPPASPVAPPAPRAPAGPPSVGGPPDGATQQLGLALLLIDPRRPVARSVIVELGDALVAVTQGGPGGHRTDPSRRADVDRLAVLLAGSLGQAGGPPDARRDVVSALAGALAGGPDRAALDAALARVHEALRAAGVAGPDAILIDAQMRRVIVGP